MQKRSGGTNNTVMQQAGLKVKICVWAILGILVIVLSVVMYDPEHRVLYTLLPIATAIPCGIKINQNIRKLQEAKEAEKIYITRHK